MSISSSSQYIQFTDDIKLYRYIPPWRQYLGIIAEQLFHISLVTYLMLLLAETIKEDFVDYFFNLNILLVVVAISGVMMSFFNTEKEQRSVINKSIPWKFIFAVSFGGMLLVYYKTETLGGLSLLIALVTGVIIFLMSYVVYTDAETLNHSDGSKDILEKT
jgi:hypothetical protein